MLASSQYDKELIEQKIDKCDQEISFNKFVDIFQLANVGDSTNQWLFTLYDKSRNHSIKKGGALLTNRT